LEGLYSAQMDRSFRWGMIWFIFSEVMFFAAFFGALFYARHISLAWLGGDTVAKAATHHYLWPDFVAQWPLLNNPNPEIFKGPTQAMPAWGLPFINTCLLLTSGVTITIAHWGLMKAKHMQLVLGLAATVGLGILFLICQGYEYYHAYHEMGLTLNSGIYGSTFFLLTGFHGLHVTLGTIMLIVITLRSIKRHFKPEHHFAFEAVAWYWHFVDVVWLFLFIFVYMV
jgi:cytochrome c oxidase subunit III